MEDKDEERRKIETNIRSVTQSCKGGIPIERLERDYRVMIGSSIPYEVLGYNSLDAMIRSMPDVIRIVRNGMGQAVVMSVADKTTEHIEKMVSKQKDHKPKRMINPKYKSYRLPPRGPVYGNRGPSYVKQYPTQQRFSGQSPLRKYVQKSPPHRFVQRTPPPLLPMPPPRPTLVPRAKETIRRVLEPSSRKQIPHNSSYEVPPRFKRLIVTCDNSERSSSLSDGKSNEDEEEDKECWPLAEATHERPSGKKPLGPIQLNKIPSPKPLEKIPSPKLLVKIPSPRMQEFIPSPKAPEFIPSPKAAEFIPSPKAQEFIQRPKPHENIQSPKPQVRIPSPKPKKKITVTIPPLTRELTAKQYVAKYAEMIGITPMYKTSTIGQKRKNFISVLTLGDKKYKSFPIEKPTVQEAEEVTASYAREDIELKASETKYEETSIETPDDVNKLMTRVEEVVATKPNGMWSDYCSEQYRIKYQENLPSAWLPLVQQHLSGIVDIEVPDGLNLPKDACILRISKMSSGTTTPTSTSSRMSNPLEEECVDVMRKDSKTMDAILPDVQNITLSSGEQWSIIVTSVATTEQISARSIDSDAFYDLIDRISAFYQMQGTAVQCVKQGKLYIARVGENYWHRVRVDHFVPQTSEVTCYFVDVGESSILNLSDLRELDPAFQELPFQAVILKLDGLEEYVDLVKLEYLDEILLDKTFIAEVVNSIEGETSVILYDTSGENDINVNEYLKETAIKACFEFEMPEVGSTAMSHLTHVTIFGDVFLRLSHPAIGLLEYEINKLAPKFECEALNSPATNLSTDKMYASKFIDGVWYRAMIVTISDANPYEVEAFFVDYGNTYWVSCDCICELEPISKMLVEIPWQAVPCHLSGIPSDLYWTEDTIKKINSLIPDDEQIIMKIDCVATEVNQTLVSLYTRNEDSAIVSINDTLALDKSLFRLEPAFDESTSSAAPLKPYSLPLQKDSNQLSQFIPDVAVPAAEIEVQMAKQQISETNAQATWTPTPTSDAVLDMFNKDASIPPPALPEENSSFDVYIPWVASPSNFVIQPLKSSKELEDLQDEMLQFYSCEENLCEMHLCLLKEENVYAALHKDNVWYRACIKQIKQDEPVMATVHFVDYGDYSMIDMTNLQPLYRKFRLLPCQAIKATLSGIRPCAENWENEDCFAFRKLVEEKSLVAIIKKHQNKEVDFENSILEVTLVDTSEPDKDVAIHDQLIANKMATVA